MANDTFQFTRQLPVADDFNDAFGDSGFIEVPSDWLVAVTDVTGSRQAIAQGRYKAVNMAGVAMISAVMNRLDGYDIPYIFGGDGAAIVLAPSERAIVEPALAECVTFVGEELGLVLRAALVPASRLRQDGFDVRVRRIRVSDAIENFAFVGGGLTQAEKLMKAGEYAIPGAAAGARPDLTGLSCRWTPISEAGRQIVSLIVEPGEGTTAERFGSLERRLLAIAGGDGAGSPVPAEGPGVRWPPEGLELEARATGSPEGLTKRRWRLYLTTLLGWFLFRTGMPLGSFKPDHYRRVTGLNTDFRKIQDGLRMTLSVDERQLEALRNELDREVEAGTIRYGICVQDSAVLTCYVPSITSDVHYHFLDGAGGGYAEAASAMAGNPATTGS